MSLDESFGADDLWHGFRLSGLVSRLFDPQVLQLAGEGDVSESLDVDLWIIADGAAPIAQLGFHSPIKREAEELTKVG
jgi:hypothetical protein